MLKLFQGGWFSLLAGALIFRLMSTWKRGRELMMEQAKTPAGQASLRNYLADVFRQPPLRVRGTAMFLNLHLTAVPHALINNLEHNGVLHDKAIFLTVTTCSLPMSRPASGSKSRRSRTTALLSL